MNLEMRTKEQLLADFEGPQEEQLKLLNLIHSLFEAIGEATPPPLPGPVPEYSEDPTALAAALVRAGLMQEDEA